MVERSSYWYLALLPFWLAWKILKPVLLIAYVLIGGTVVAWLLYLLAYQVAGNG